jgi:hypothetical protein
MAVGGGLLIPLIWIIADFTFKNRELALKQEMLERGMTAEQIVQVLKASNSASPCKSTRTGQSQQAGMC